MTGSRPTSTPPEPHPIQPDRTKHPFDDAGHDQNGQTGQSGQPDNTQQPEETPGPVSAAPDRGPAKGVPHISANPKFWQADHPAGFDDPAWRQTVPFSTFDDVMDGGGTGTDPL